MKLYELTGIKKLNSLSVSDLIMYFIDNSKYMFAGNGAQAYVFIHPNNKEVIKFWMFDSAYESFIKYVKEHQSNQFLPKIIKGINELKFKNHTIKYIRMEKLKELNNSTTIFGVEFKNLINAIDKHIEKKGISKILSDYKNQIKDSYQQTNYYLFHPLLEKKKYSLRIREKKGHYELTLKRPSTIGLNELNIDINKEIKDAINNILL